MPENLSPREREVFDLLLEGISQKEIANKLNISHSTLDFHRTNLYKKLGVHSIKELFAKYSTNGKVVLYEPGTALLVPETKKDKRLKKLLPAGIIFLALSVLFLWTFIRKSSAYSAQHGEIISIYNLGFYPWTDANDKRGESTVEVFISSEEIDGVGINGVLNIKANLKGRKDSNEFYVDINTTKYDVIQRLRRANGIRFKARGDGKMWVVKFFMKESTQERNYAHYQYTFGTVRDKVIVYDIPYSSLILPEWFEKDSFDFNKESIKIMGISADNTTQGAGSSSLQIFDFEIY